MKKRFGIVWLMMSLLVIPLSAQAKSGLTPCIMIPQWSPQAQFAGYYVAMEKGIYRKHGIRMTILKGGPGRPALEYLRDGRADFAVQWLTTAIQRYDEGIRLVNLGQVVPRSSMMLVAKKTSHILKPSDMNGKKVGIWEGDFAIPPRAFFKKYGLQVKEIPQSYTVNLFLRGGVDVASAMWYNEYHTILNSGIDPDELIVFPLCDYGLNFPEDGLYMMEAAYKKNPGLAAAFVQASFEGWQYAFDHPDQALDIVIRYMREANVPSNRAHQKWMLSRMKNLIMSTDGSMPTRKLNTTDFNTVAQYLLHDGLIGKAPDFSTFTVNLQADN
jgi:NitT/TauT family transport system substrate-binding protein